jgi:hypothetical protein
LPTIRARGWKKREAQSLVLTPGSGLTRRFWMGLGMLKFDWHMV